jgi:hypothetical protein
MADDFDVDLKGLMSRATPLGEFLEVGHFIFGMHRGLVEAGFTSDESFQFIATLMTQKPGEDA